MRNIVLYMYPPNRIIKSISSLFHYINYSRAICVNSCVLYLILGSAIWCSFVETQELAFIGKIIQLENCLLHEALKKGTTKHRDY